MTRLALPLITAMAVFMLGDALGDKDWLLAFPLAVIAISALVLLSIAACDAPPSASLEYTAGVNGSFGERFACTECASAIRTLRHPSGEQS